MAEEDSNNGGSSGGNDSSEVGTHPASVTMMVHPYNISYGLLADLLQPAISSAQAKIKRKD